MSYVLLRAVFSFFHGQKIYFLFFFHCSVRTKKLLDIKFEIGKYFRGVKTCFFGASCFGYYSKGCLSATPSLSLLDDKQLQPIG